MSDILKNPIAQQIMSEAQRTGNDPHTMLATAIVESSLDPGAVGDGGTSFGLYQNHKGGAGGPTIASAQRFTDPKLSISDAMRRFGGGGAGGKFAASIQRPADPSGYAVKVDQWIERLKRGTASIGMGGAGSASQPFVPATKDKGRTTAPDATDRRMRAFEIVFEDDPEMLSLLKPFINRQRDTVEEQASEAVPDTMVGAEIPYGPKAFPRKANEEAWRYLKRLGGTLFNLQNDPGQAQTTGGRHAENSFHYSGRAIDFGDARNSREQLNAWYSWVDKHRDVLGVTELLDEGDHIHVALRA